MQEHVPRVLVVDDEEHITELLSMGLSMNGFEVERAATGRGALKAIEEQRPDLVVLDVMLPTSTASTSPRGSVRPKGRGPGSPSSSLQPGTRPRTRSKAFALAATTT